jgi:hypothetical protein
MEKPFTEEDLDACWSWYKSYLIDILNGDYDIETAREDLRGLIGSKFDKRFTEELTIETNKP